MDYQTAINQSAKGTAIREIEADGFKRSTIRYNDGSGFVLVSKNGKVDFSLSRPAQACDLNGYQDWQPSN